MKCEIFGWMYSYLRFFWFSIPNIFLCIKSQKWKTRGKHFDAEKLGGWGGEQIKQPKWNKKWTIKKENKMTTPSKQKQFLKDENTWSSSSSLSTLSEKRIFTKRDWWVVVVGWFGWHIIFHLMLLFSFYSLCSSDFFAMTFKRKAVGLLQGPW